jgi:hypothetical protein
VLNTSKYADNNIIITTKKSYCKKKITQYINGLSKNKNRMVLKTNVKKEERDMQKIVSPNLHGHKNVFFSTTENI